jgi:hypothetical protein
MVETVIKDLEVWVKIQLQQPNTPRLVDHSIQFKPRPLFVGCSWFYFYWCLFTSGFAVLKALDMTTKGVRHTQCCRVCERVTTKGVRHDY